MLCGKCGKKEATVHIQKIVNGKVESMHLCQDCANELSGSEAMDGINLAEILMNIAGKAVQKAVGKKKPSQPVPVCPECGWDLEKFQKTGYFGCPECYSVFAENLEPMLSGMHRGMIHTGKIPPQSEKDRAGHEKAMMRQRIKELEKIMELHVGAEEYEEAAKLRDEIRRLKKQISSGESSL